MLQVEELTGELEVKCRELGKLQEAHTELQHKCTKLSLSKNGQLARTTSSAPPVVLTRRLVPQQVQ